MNDQEQPTNECRRCGCRHHHILRVTRYPNFIRQHRECRHCGNRFTTVERPLLPQQGHDIETEARHG